MILAVGNSKQLVNSLPKEIAEVASSFTHFTFKFLIIFLHVWFSISVFIFHSGVLTPGSGISTSVITIHLLC